MISADGRHDWSELVTHPATPSAAVTGLFGCARLTGGNEIELAYELAGDPDRIVWPAPRAQGFREGLWRHTCFELFVGAHAGDRYLEFNFAPPSREWCGYAFQGYRENRSTIEDIDMSHFETVCGETHFSLCVRFSLVSAPSFALPESIVGLAVIIEQSDGQVSYWALAHPAARPDFHDRRGFRASLLHAEDTQ